LHRPVAIGVPVTATATVKEKRAETGTVLLECQAVDPTGEEVASGFVEVLAPREKMRHELLDLPKVQLRRDNRYLDLLRACEGLPALGLARSSIRVAPTRCAARSRRPSTGLIDPILIGPEDKIRAMAAQEHLDLRRTDWCRRSTAIIPPNWRSPWCCPARRRP
jgi:phosphate acetyltransferase